jgi:ADP-ribosylglycohydrolase
MDLNADQFTGALLGLATGDALGAPHEGGLLERLIWRLIGRTPDGCLRWTDDTQMAIDVAESLIEHDGLSVDSLAQRFAASYRWSRGYGPGATRLLKRIRRGHSWHEASKAIFADGSYGNGAAMRASVLALFFARDLDGLLAAARKSAAITHSHPLGIEGAVLIAVAAHTLLEGKSPTEVLDVVEAQCSSAQMVEKMKVVRTWIESRKSPSTRDVARVLGNGITATTSCPTAIYVALRHREASFEAMIEFVIRCRGDVDTIGAMSGALWGIANGSERLPKVRLEGRELLVDLASRILRKHR